MNALLIGLYLLLSGCEDNDNKPVTPPEGSKIYEACCGIEPVEYIVGNGKLFFPNVFTPNGDGLNDYFIPSISPEIIEASGFILTNLDSNKVLFLRSGMNFSDPENYGWNGIDKDGIEYEGQFLWEMYVIAKDGSSGLLKGKGCRIVCGPNAVVFVDKDGCYYSEQANAGFLNQSNAMQEGDCFK